MEYRSVRVNDLIRDTNRALYLPAIQREFVWGTEKVERLFDSVMQDFPIGTFLFWKLEHENKDKWPIYEFIRKFDEESPHNAEADLAGITNDFNLVLDGQQRITSLYIGLKGSFRFFYYRWKVARLYLNLLKPPIPNEDNPEELTYAFSFRENGTPERDKEDQQLWYQVGRILDHEDAEDAKADIKEILSPLPEEKRDNANRLIGRLHSRIHTVQVGNYYAENSQDPERVLQIFVRANSGGQILEYPHLLLSTATAKWKTMDARQEIQNFTDAINGIGPVTSLARISFSKHAFI